MTTAATTSQHPDVETLEGIIRAYSDVTEQLKQSHEMLTGEVARLHSQLEEKNKELARGERLAALGEMAAGVAHEIRNPLAGIGLFATLLGKDLEDRPEQQKLAEKIGKGVKKLDSIVSEILAFSRGAEPDLRNVAVGEIIENLAPQIAPQIDVLSASFHIEPGVADVVLWCDACQIERALANLVFNALDVTPEGGAVSLRFEKAIGDKRMALLIVEDEGPGIAESELQRVFNPFFTTKDSGTGLGLAIVHRIAESHGGYVSAGNREGGGASFTLAVPLGESGNAEHAGGDE